MNSKHIRIFGLVSACAALAAAPVFAGTFTQTHHHLLVADGPDKGKSPYALIEKAYGKRSIEAPDLYKSNHPEQLHIVEDVDDIVGPHFIFLSHMSADGDRDKDFTDRQRNEIKVFDKSDAALKGFENETLQYRWKFKVGSDFEYSKSFTHFFQIKAKNAGYVNEVKDSDKFPVLTITAVDRGAKGNELQLRHSPSLTQEGERLKFRKLIREDMARFSDQWIEFFVQVTYSDHGPLIFQAKNLETGELLVDYKNDDIDMWRGQTRLDFARPKWGIYRSLKDKDSLRKEEEQARFADFSISKGIVK